MQCFVGAPRSSKPSEDTLIDAFQSFLVNPGLAEAFGAERVKRDTNNDWDNEYSLDRLGVTGRVKYIDASQPMKGAKAEVDIENLNKIFPHLPFQDVKLIIDADNLKDIDDDLFKINAQVIIEGRTHRLIISRKKGSKGWTTHVETSTGQTINIKSDRKKYLDIELTDELYFGTYKFGGKIVNPKEAEADIIFRGRLYKLIASWNKGSNLLSAALKNLRGQDVASIAVKKDGTTFTLDVSTSLIPGLSSSSLKLTLGKDAGDGSYSMLVKVFTMERKIIDLDLKTLFDQTTMMIEAQLSEEWIYGDSKVVIRADLQKGASLFFTVNNRKIFEFKSDYKLSSGDPTVKFELSAELTAGEWIKKKFDWHKKEFSIYVSNEGLAGNVVSSLKKDEEILFDLEINTSKAPYTVAIKAPELLRSLLKTDKPSIVFNVDVSKTDGVDTKIVLSAEKNPTIVLERQPDGRAALSVDGAVVAFISFWISEAKIHSSVGMLLPWAQPNITLDIDWESAIKVDLSGFFDDSNNVKANLVWQKNTNWEYDWSMNGVIADVGIKSFNVEEHRSWRDTGNVVYRYKEKTETDTYSYGYDIEFDFNSNKWRFNEARYSVMLNNLGLVYSIEDGFSISPSIPEVVDGICNFLKTCEA